MTTLDDLPYPLILRLRFIDCMLAHFASVNRIVIIDYFGISLPQASLDIRKYTELAPTNMAYSLKDKTYHRTDTFQKVWP